MRYRSNVRLNIEERASMTDVFFDPPRNDEAWRDMIYDGGIILSLIHI